VIAETRKSGSAETALPMPLIEAELSQRIIGCSIQVHRSLGPGFLEKIYEEALAIEMNKAGLGFERQKIVQIHYAGIRVGEHRLDYLIESKVVLELKAAREIEDIHLATARSYLKALAVPLALVVNFAKPVLEIRRVVLTV
jgi:GxxExxY protein